MAISYVTGATGFIGSHLAEILKGKGHDVRLLVRSPVRLHDELKEGYEVVQGTLNDEPEKLAEGLKGADYIYHVAGLIGAVKQADFDKVNIEGTRAMIEAVKASGTTPKRFLLVSSLAAIGPSEGPDKPTEEHHGPQPRTMYGRSKLAGEKLAFELCAKYEIPLTVVRPPAVYGPRDRGIFEFFKYMAKGYEVGIGRVTRTLDLIHGRDLSRGMIMAAESGRTVGEAYFLTDEGKHELTYLMKVMREVMQPKKQRKMIAPIWMVKVLARINDVLQRVSGKMLLPNSDKLGDLLPTSWCCSGAKAREHFGFEAEIDLAEGLKETSDWYEKAGWIKVKR